MREPFGYFQDLEFACWKGTKFASDFTKEKVSLHCDSSGTLETFSTVTEECVEGGVDIVNRCTFFINHVYEKNTHLHYFIAHIHVCIFGAIVPTCFPRPIQFRACLLPRPPRRPSRSELQHTVWRIPQAQQGGDEVQTGPRGLLGSESRLDKCHLLHATGRVPKLSWPEVGHVCLFPGGQWRLEDGDDLGNRQA